MNWNNIRPLNGSQHHGFEELCAQLAKREPEMVRAKFYRNGTPDGGVECYATFGNNSEWGWQAKYVDTLGPTQWAEIDRSVKTALETHPNLSKYFICVPLDLPDSGKSKQKTARKRWNEKVAEWSKGRTIEFVFWGNHELVNCLHKVENRGIIYFWFNSEVFTSEWFKNKVDKTIEDVRNRFTPLLDLAVPLYRNFEGLGNLDSYLTEAKKALYDFKKQLVIEVREFPELFSLNSTIFDALKQSAEKLTDWEPHTFPDICKELQDLSEPISEWVEKLPRDKKTANERENLDSRGWIFRNTLYTLIATLRDEAILTAAKRALLVVGRAGYGKTHLFAHIARTRIDDGLGTIFLQGKYFTGASDPISTMRDWLGLTCTHEEFLGALNAAGEVQQKPVVILIDAINEGQGRELWKGQLAGVVKQIKDYPWLSIALSIRDQYEKELIEEHVAAEFKRVEHNGFGDSSLEAALKFFAFYGLQNPDIPILLPEFESPLFLTLFCKAVKSGKIPKSAMSELPFTIVLKGFLEGIEENVSSNLRIRASQHIPTKAARLIAQKMGEEGWGVLDTPDALKLLRENITEVEADELLTEMASEGMLIESIYDYSPQERRDIISFAYERLGDFLIAEEVLRLNPVQKNEVVTEKHGLWKFLGDELKCNHFSGIVRSLAVLLPETIGVELFEFAPQVAKAHEVCEAVIDSIVWRKKESISNVTKSYLRDTAQGYRDTHESWIETLITLAPVPNHPFNIDYLSGALRRLSIAERDTAWSITLHDFWQYQNASLRRLIHWATNSELHSLVAPEYKFLAVRTLAWFFASSNRELRDLSTKGVSLLLATDFSAAKKLYKEFNDIDDPYIVERVMCSLYAAVIMSSKFDGLEDLARTVLETFFADHKTPTSHLLARDYARGIIEFAIRVNDIQIDPALISPPYGSVWDPTTLPSADSLKPTDKNWDERTAEEKAYHDLYESIFGFGDFARYIIGANHSGSTNWSSIRLNEPIPDNEKSEYYGLPPFDLSLVQRAVMNRVLQLGWTGEYFAEFDNKINRNRWDRAANKPERIGKKYQWIGFRETQGQLADNFRFKDWNGEAIYDGPWQLGFHRDIDPTLPILKSHGEHMHDQSRTWWFPVSIKDWGKGSPIEEWLDDESNLPNPREFLYVKDSNSVEWVNLLSYNAWSELSSDSPERDEIPFNQVWYITNGFFVKDSCKKSVVEWIKNVPDAGNGHFESHIEVHDCFYRELYWSRAYEHSSSYNPDFYLNYSGDIAPPSPLQMVGVDFMHERGGYDCSISDTINVRCPAGWLYEDLKLRYDSRVGAFSDSTGIIIQDPSVYVAGPSSLLIRKNDLLKYLADKGLAVVWCIIGEKIRLKSSSTYDFPRRYLRGVYSMDASGNLEGAMVTRADGW